MLAAIILAILGAAASQEQYCVIIDAGSTGSRVHIYGVLYAEESVVPSVRQVSAGLQTHVALATFSSRPHLAGTSLNNLIDHAQQQVPDSQKAETGIHLLATAGLRLLNAALTSSILESCRKALAASGFRFEDKWAAVLPGSTEGIYSFVAANYASGKLEQAVLLNKQGLLGSEQDDFVGVLELGGASLQVTFYVDSSKESHVSSRHFSIEGLELNVFTHSFLGLGQDSAQQTALLSASTKLIGIPEESSPGMPAALRVLDPCLPLGYEGELSGIPVSGGGYFGLCRQMTAGIVMGNCSALHCVLAGLHLPPLTGKFLGIENLQYTAGFLGLPHGATIRQFLEAAQASCSMAWPDMLHQYQHFETDHLLRYCFGAAYAVALLHDGLGIGLDDSSLMFTDTVETPAGEHILLDWTLGAVVLAATRQSTFQAFDREFPMYGGNQSTPGLKVATSDHGSTAESTAAGKVLLFLGIAIAVACLAYSRKPRKAWKRKRRRSRVGGRPPEPLDTEGGQDDESTDSEGLFNLGSLSPRAMGRRQHALRSADLEQGITQG